jgi:hypothetical protein
MNFYQNHTIIIIKTIILSDNIEEHKFYRSLDEKKTYNIVGAWCEHRQDHDNIMKT